MEHLLSLLLSPLPLNHVQALTPPLHIKLAQAASLNQSPIAQARMVVGHLWLRMDWEWASCDLLTSWLSHQRLASALWKDARCNLRHVFVA